MTTSRTEQPTTEAEEEHARMARRLKRLQESAENTAPRHRNYHLRSEIEMLKVNLKSMERRHGIQPLPSA